MYKPQKMGCAWVSAVAVSSAIAHGRSVRTGVSQALKPNLGGKKLLHFGRELVISLWNEKGTSVTLERAVTVEDDETWTNRVYNVDSTKPLYFVPDEGVHLILSDIPYGIGVEDWDVLHSNTNSAYMGNSPAQAKAGAVFKKRGKPINGWSDADRAMPREYQEWCGNWAADWHRMLKPGASALVFAGRRFAHRCICAMEDAGFSFKDMLAWHRDRAPHRAQRLNIVYERRGDQESAETWSGWRVGNLRPTFEPILWFTKPYKIGTTIADNALRHGVGAYNEEAFLRYVPRPDNVLELGFAPNESGLHPTQKPLLLMQALIELVTQPGQVVLDPFCGSGSTLLAASNLERRYVGCDLNSDYVSIAEKRITAKKSLLL